MKNQKGLLLLVAVQMNWRMLLTRGGHHVPGEHSARARRSCFCTNSRRFYSRRNVGQPEGHRRSDQGRNGDISLQSFRLPLSIIRCSALCVCLHLAGLVVCGLRHALPDRVAALQQLG